MSEINEWVNWVEDALSKKHIKHYEYNYFSNIQEIGISSIGKVYRASWKNSDQYVALKSLVNLDNIIVKELVRELEFQREVAFHNNIISFYGITISDQENQNDKKYLLVMEYADGGSLKNYLKENYNNLTWTDKYKLAYQLACAIAFLHDEGIVHHDLNSNNILVHQGTIKLPDFGLSKKIDDEYDEQSNLPKIPYIDPKRFSTRSYPLNEKSNVYSIGVLLWEISKGRPPFYSEGESYDNNLAMQILQGLREKIVPDTPVDYVKLYTECWENEPENRPYIHKVVERLKSMISQSSTTLYQQQNENLNLTATETTEYTQSTSSTISQNILHESELNLNIKELDSTTSAIDKQMNDLKKSHILAQYFVGKCYQNGYGIMKNEELAFQYFEKLANDNYAIGQLDVGYCYNLGIGIKVDLKKAIYWYEKSANNGNIVAIYKLGQKYINGMGINKDYKKAFELFEKSAEGGYLDGIVMIGACCSGGIGTNVDWKKAFESFQKAANLGSMIAQYNLANMYKNGEGIERDISKAIYWFKISADQGYSNAQKQLEKLMKNE
ncbi:kinase-like domain-containing protein [Rhizophagus clarus]|uniref:Kinase-like domain-containing protein n=1 Tax=Rhizophagus clarus TaxID=94130 RepID=A0A8H3MEI0_9GLOM|nr:kinase-like domain-containing protein [Rhizophagus clarus]